AWAAVYSLALRSGTKTRPLRKESARRSSAVLAYINQPTGWTCRLHSEWAQAGSRFDIQIAIERNEGGGLWLRGAYRLGSQPTCGLRRPDDIIPRSNGGNSPMKALHDVTVRVNSGAAWEMKKGQRARITFQSIVDFVVFNRDNLQERFDQA